MDHNLEDSLNLESDMGSMDFDHSGVVVNQADITLETSHEEDIPMQFEQIEEQPMLMDTGNEEIIVSDFMNDQYTLREYSVQDDQITEDTSGAVESDQLSVLTSQADSMIDLKFEPQASVSQDVTIQPQYISVKAAVGPTRAPIKSDMLVASMPRQVPIAPKPIPAPRAPKVLNTRPFIKQPKPATNNPTVGKQFAIAPKPGPKPVALVANKTPTGLNKLLTGVIPGNMKRGTVLTQIGKQLVMMPAGAQKIKLVSSNSGTFQYVRANSDQAQLIATKSGSGANPQKLLQAKVIVQGTSQTDSNQPAVITKLLPAGSSAAPQTRYVMQQKTVPISIGGNKVILTSPTKSGMKFGKKQIIAIKSPTPKLIPATSHGTTKKVVITTNPNQNVILKTTAPPKTTQLNKDGNVVVQGQRSQLHQINVPGKGIQYIRLITNSSPAPQKVVPKAQPPVLAVPSKSFVLTDNKGNLIQMTAEKVSSGQPPPLIITGSIGATSRMTTKPQRKLVRIAPVTAKTAQATQQPTRSAQSLLAPLSPTADCKLEESAVTDLLAGRTMSRDSQDLADDAAEASAEDLEPEEEIHSKAELRALLDDAVTEDTDAMHTMHEVEVDFEKREAAEDEEEDNSMEHDSSHKSEEHPLIVIPTNFVKQESQIRVTSEHSRRKDDSLNYTNIETEVMAPYLSPKPSHAVSESDIVAGELGMRPRKACNCTKSQCLKLYCDCFANGEFCNRCNCNNCHNNLENEELRQKAIRACLDRNPNAFRPKIGKAKSGGPEIVRRHNKGCNCKRSGCLKNYCECFEAKIACTVMCKCVGCRNVEDTLERRRAVRRAGAAARPPPPALHLRQPCSFMTSEVIEAVCQCLVAAAVESGEGREGEAERGERGGEGERGEEAADPVRDVIEEFARCLQDIISASHQSTAVSVLDEVTAP